MSTIFNTIKKEISYYLKDFYSAFFGSLFRVDVTYDKSKINPKYKERADEFLGFENRKNNLLPPKQRILNNAFYATFGQIMVSVFLGIVSGLPKGFQAGPLFYPLYVVDAFVYILLGFFVSKNKLWAGIGLLIWFSIDKLLPGVIYLFSNLSLRSLFYFIIYYYFFGQFYYKAFICLKRDYNQGRK